MEACASGSVAEFFEQLAQAAQSLLLLDYDGTLAPFQVERNSAYPYPGVVPLLEKILDRGNSKVVIITGRPVASLRPLLSPSLQVEIWGSHGMEHLLADGTCRQITIDPEPAALLASAESWFRAAGFSRQLEVKPGGIAIHWRGLPPQQGEETRAAAQQGMASYSKRPGIALLEFDGGVEMRVARPNKGDAVRSLLSCSPANIPVAYLGDDLTDESAFQALNGHGLSVLVRSEFRETSARVWLRPPVELMAFLQRWLNSLSR